jgi:hypothetical protein
MTLYRILAIQDHRHFVPVPTPMPMLTSTPIYNTHIHTPYIPSNPTVYFENTYPHVSSFSTDIPGTASLTGGLSSTTPQPSNHTYPVSFLAMLLLTIL